MEQRLRIGILTHFNSFQAGYALAVGWRERARLLEYFDQDFDFLVNESAPEGLYPNQRNCLARMPKDEPFEKRAKFFRDDYLEKLAPYDVIMTADLIYQGKGNFLAWNQAMRWANDEFKRQGQDKRWLHWIHSAFNHRKARAPYPESLRFRPMDDSTIVYMNESEKAGAAAQYGLSPEQVACVYNPKDFRSFHGFHPLAWEITKKLEIWKKDFVQLFPFCTTRMDAKGTIEVIEMAAAIKRAGKSVALILANANARKMAFEIVRKIEMGERAGLTYGEDFLFTSDIVDRKGPLPREAVANLFLCSNYFAFGSWREVCPNVLLEAKISGNYLMVNSNTAPAVEFGGPKAGKFNAPAKIPGVPDGPNDFRKVRMRPQSYDAAAAEIIQNAPSRAHLWEFSFERIWNEQLGPLLYGAAPKQNQKESGP